MGPVRTTGGFQGRTVCVPDQPEVRDPNEGPVVRDFLGDYRAAGSVPHGGPSMAPERRCRVARRNRAGWDVATAVQRSKLKTQVITMENGGGGSTAGMDYAQRIARLSLTRWKQVLDVQAVYRWNIRRLHLGRTLDVGCGLGRNLEHLGSSAVGVDHNAVSIAVARSRGLRAYTCEEFAESPDAVPRSYDSLLFSHVFEHLDRDHAVGLLKQYLPYLEPGGHVVVITPQERGFRSDTTHVTFIDFAGQRKIATAAGLDVIRQFSFPLPRVAGRLFVYNEFVAVTRFLGDSA